MKNRKGGFAAGILVVIVTVMMASGCVHGLHKDHDDNKKTKRDIGCH